MPASIAGLADGAHVVQFYSDDALLVDAVARVVGTALIVGDAAIVIATDAHEAALRKSLRARGFDIEVAAQQGRCLFANAATLATRFVERGVFDSDAFRTMLDEMVARARAACEKHPGRVVIFGEMAEQLVRTGLLAAAIDAERLGNELAKREPVAICCGYSMQSFRGEHATAPFLHVCGVHSQVFPAERRSAARLKGSSAADRR